jgi:hypothetical protein
VAGCDVEQCPKRGGDRFPRLLCAGRAQLTQILSSVVRLRAVTPPRPRVIGQIVLGDTRATAMLTGGARSLKGAQPTGLYTWCEWPVHQCTNIQMRVGSSLSICPNPPRTSTVREGLLPRTGAGAVGTFARADKDTLLIRIARTRSRSLQRTCGREPGRLIHNLTGSQR